MKDYDLYTAYVLRFGLTFLPKGLSDAAWAAATELMVRALKEMGPIVTHALIAARLDTGVKHAKAACSGITTHPADPARFGSSRPTTDHEIAPTLQALWTAPQ